MRCREFYSKLIWDSVGEIEIVYVPSYEAFRLIITKSKRSDEEVFNYLMNSFSMDGTFECYTGRIEVSFYIYYTVNKNTNRNKKQADTFFSRALLKAQDIIEVELNNYKKTKGEGNE